MKACTRRSIAFVIAKLINKSVSSIYDYSEGRYFNFIGDITNTSVSFYDYNEGFTYQAIKAQTLTIYTTTATEGT